MAGSGEHRRLRNESQAERDETQTPQGRLCDFCGESNSLLYCRADSAKLCFRCDREVHSTNLLFTKHTRNQLCDACDSKPASIHCSTENMVLCQNCDWDSHGGNSDHDRRPLEGFTGCPSASELSSILGFKDLGDKSLMSCGGGGGGCEDKNLMGSDLDVDWISDLLVWETPSVNSFDDLILSTDSSQNFHALDVPSLPKNRDTVCGKYKEAIVCQLREMLKLETNWKPDNEDGESLLPEPNFQPGFANNAVFEHDTKAIGCSVPENNGITWKGNPSETAVMIPIPSFSRTSTEEGSLVNDKANDCGGNGDASDGHGMQSQHSIIREPVPFLSKFAPSELTSHNRESSLSRYKEKKKTRRYDKHIRYETRKARAESRTRIKGRFAKVVDQ